VQPINTFLDDGHAAELILLVVIIEFAVLLWRYLRRGGAPPGQWLSPLVAGASLVLALRLAQGEAAPQFIGLALICAGVAHLAGYRQRWG
jgi:hypothetical protein